MAKQLTTFCSAPMRAGAAFLVGAGATAYQPKRSLDELKDLLPAAQ